MLILTRNNRRFLFRSVLTATISCLTVIVKKRPQYLKPAMNAFKSWRKTKTKDDSPVMLRNVDKALKLAFVSLIRYKPHKCVKVL